MKNLMIYIGPEKRFSSEHEILTKMQIDNSLELGWKPEDIILVTDFPWEYRGIKSYVLPEGDYRAIDGNRSSKVLVINQLFKEGHIKDGEIYWFHDHDAFQLVPMRDPELGEAVAGFTNQGWDPEWNAGSFFFTSGAKDIFLKVYETMLKNNSNEQNALTHLWDEGLTGYKLLNSTYNVGIYHLWQVLKTIEKPQIVAHFHPRKSAHMDLFRPYLPNRLKEIFKTYGIT